MDSGPPALPSYDANPTPPPVAASITPDHAFLARHAQATVDGYSTSWTSATSVDLGPGITVDTVSAKTPVELDVAFDVAADAGLGPRDVTLHDVGEAAEVDPGGLAIDSPVALTFEGTLAQGSIVVAHVSVVDPSVPLDLTTTTNAFGQTIFTNLAPALPAGLSGTVLAATFYDANVEIFIDEPTTGAEDFDLVSGPPGGASDAHFPGPGALPVAARTPIALTSGTAATGNVASEYATGLYVYTPAAATPTILDFTASSDATAGDPAVLLLPASGSWADELRGGATATWVTLTTDPVYAVYFDDSGSTGGYSVAVTATAPASTAAASPGDATMAGAIVAPALPFVLTGGSLTSSTSEDWVAFTTGPADAGKHLHVQSAGDPHTFLDVTIYDDDGMTSLGGNENGGPVDAQAGPLDASHTYYVVFSAGAGFDPAHGSYVGLVRYE